MNDQTSTNSLTTVAADAAPALDQKNLLTIKPEVYAATVFDPFYKQLTKAKRVAKALSAYDITTTAGMTIAKEQRAIFRAIRTGADKAKVEHKRPIDAIGKLILAKYKELEDDVLPLEDKFDGEIKAEETRKAEEKAEKERQERARIEAIENRIAHIRNATARHLKSDSAAIAKEIEQYTILRLDPADYEELLEDALNAVNKTLDDLEVMRVQAVDREDAQRKAEEDARELLRLKTEAAERERIQKEESAKREEAEHQRIKAAADAAEAQAKMIADLQAQLAAAQKPVDPAPLQPGSLDANYREVVVPADVVAEAVSTIPAAVVAPVVVAVQDEPEQPAITRPTDAEILNELALKYGVSLATALDWIMMMDIDALVLYAEME